MDILIIIGLLVAGIILLLVEVFLIPGISLAAIGAAGCMIYANWHAFTTLGTVPGVVTLFVTIVATVAVIAGFMRSKSLDKLSLKSNIDSTVKQPESADIQPGDTGVALTRLAQIGNAEFDGRIVEVRTAGEFIDARTPIRVDRIRDGVIVVTALEN